MFGLGFSEIFVIGLIVLVCYGPDKIPEVARIFSKSLVQVKRFTNDLKRNIQENVQQAGGEEWKQLQNLQRKVQEFRAHGDASQYLDRLAETLDQDKQVLTTLQEAKKQTTEVVQVAKTQWQESVAALVVPVQQPEEKAAVAQKEKQTTKKNPALKNNRTKKPQQPQTDLSAQKHAKQSVKNATTTAASRLTKSTKKPKA